MKRIFPIIIIVIGFVNLTSPVTKEEFPIVLVPQVNVSQNPSACDTCAETLISPTFEFTVVSGRFPDPKSPHVFKCRSYMGDEDKGNLYCEDGLVLKIRRITFR